MKKKLLSLGLAVAMVLGVMPVLEQSASATGSAVTMVSAGTEHTMAIKEDGSLWAWGSGADGRVGDYTNSYIPIKIMDNVVSVSAGRAYGSYTMAIKEDGSLWAWGNNAHGQLGDGTTQTYFTPNKKIMDNVVSVSAGMYHTMAIKEDGSLWAWGSNSRGQLGDGTTINSYTPIKVMDNVVSVSAGSYHTTAIQEDGSLWTWGQNTTGELGDGTTTTSYTPIKVMDNVVSVSAGSNNTMVIKDDGSLWAWGQNSWCQLGDGTATDRYTPIKIMDNVVSVSEGLHHTMAIKEDGSLWAWGYNSVGQLGDGTATNRYTPIKIMDNVVSVSAGWNHTITIKEDGSVWVWGYNTYGQLGDGTTTTSYSPIKINVSDDIGGNNSSISNISVDIPRNGFAVIILDENGAAIQGATVTATANYSSVTTDSSGVAIFYSVPSGGTANISVHKDGYQSISVVREITKGGWTGVTLYKDDGNIHITSITGTLDSKTVDLTSGYMYFKSNAEKTTQSTNNVKSFTISVEASSSSSISKYQLIQSGEVVYESSTPNFSILVLTGTPSSPNAFGSDLRITSLKAGHLVQLRVVDTDGNTITTGSLGLRVSEPLTSSTDTSGNMTLGDKLKINVPSGVPIIGDTQISLGWNALPFDLEVAEDGTVKFAINGKKSGTSGLVDWQQVSDDYNNVLEKIVSGRSSAANAFGGKAQSFSASAISVSSNIMGYGEGHVDNNGNVTVSVGVVVTISQNASYTQTFFLGWVPIYVSIGEAVSLSGTLQLRTIKSNGKWSVSGGVGEISPSIQLNIDGGVGAKGVLSIGASGRATLTWLNRFSDNYNKVALKGEMYIVATAWLFNAEKKIGSGSWTLYDSYSRTANAYSALFDDVDFYDSESYTLMNRDYLTTNTIATMSFNTSVIKDAVYPNASPRLVQANGVSYLFWLDDIVARTDENRTALVYSISTDDGVTWGNPVQLLTEDDSSTADFGFDVAVNGDDIHIAWTKASEIFDTDVTLNEMASATEIYYAVLDTTTDTVYGLTRLTTDTAMDLTPSITYNNGIVSIGWISNAMENDIFDTDNTYCVCYASSSDWTAVASVNIDGMGISADAGTINGETTVVYVVDTDYNYDTIDDREIWIIESDSTVVQLTYNDMISNPTFANLGGSDALLWYQNGNLVYSTDLINMSDVFSEDNLPYNLTDDFSVINGTGNETKIIWEAMSSGDENATSVYATELSSGAWSSTYTLLDANNELTSTPNGYTVNGNDIITYLHTNDVDGSSVSSVRVVTAEPESDVALNCVDFTSSSIALGSNLPLTLTIQNVGSKVIDTITVGVDGTMIATISSADLGLGETKEYIVDGFTIPDNLSGVTPYAVSIAADAETNADDNAFEIQVGYTDLTVSADNLLINGDEWASIIVENKSIISTDATLRIMADEEDGIVLYEETLENIISSETKSLLINLSALSDETDVFYITISADKEEIRSTDNTTLLYLGLGKRVADITAAFIVTFDYQGADGGETSETTRTVAEDSAIGTLPEPTKTNYTFGGWYTGTNGSGTKYTASTTISSDVALYANWISESRNTSSGGGSSSDTTKYTVTFDSQGGSVIGSQSISKNNTVAEPVAPTKDGYTFTGWYTDKTLTEKYDFEHKVTSSFTLYAGWKADPDYDREIETHSAYISGYGDGTFGPDDNLTRAEAAMIFYNLLEDANIPGSSFNDVSSDTWYYEAVTALSGLGIISGYPDGSFGPDNTITRAEFTSMAIRFAGVTEVTGKSDFTDVDNTYWASGYISAAVAANYVTGYPDGTFVPGNMITRAESVTILNKIRDCDGLNSGNSFSDVPENHWAYEAISGAATVHTHN